MSKVGRPKKITEATLQKLREGFLRGYTDEQACLYANVGKSTFYDYCKENPQFSDEKEHWKENPKLKAKDTIFENLSDPKIAQWYLERKCNTEFSTLQKQEFHLSEVPIIQDDV